MKARAALIALVMLAAFALAAPSGADESEGWGYRLGHELMSPFCPGRTLSACTSSQAAELRQWIVLQEAAGASREEVITILEQRFGDVIRSRPEAKGWGMAAWLLPVFALVAGAGLAYWVLRRMVDPSGSVADEAAPAASGRVAVASGPEDLELQRLVDQEMHARD